MAGGDPTCLPGGLFRPKASGTPFFASNLRGAAEDRGAFRPLTKEQLQPEAYLSISSLQKQVRFVSEKAKCPQKVRLGCHNVFWSLWAFSGEAWHIFSIAQGCREVLPVLSQPLYLFYIMPLTLLPEQQT